MSRPLPQVESASRSNEFVETHVVGLGGRGDRPEARVEGRRVTREDGGRIAVGWRHVTGEEREIPVDGIVAGASGRRLDPVSEVAHSREIAQVVADAVRDPSQRAEATRPGRRFARVETRAHHGRHTVGADEDVTGRSPAIRQRERHAAVRHGEVDGLAAERQRVAADRLHQRAVQRLTQRNHHGGTRGRGECPDEAAVGPAYFRLRGPNALGNHGVGQAKLAQRGHGVRREGERKPQLAGVRRPLVDLHLPPGAAERQPRGEAANPGADDQRRAWS